MPEQPLEMTLANSSSSTTSWEITPKGSQPIELDQPSHCFGTITVPMASYYAVCVIEDGERYCAPRVHDPSSLVIWNGFDFHRLDPVA